MRKRELTEFGKEVKMELLIRNQPQRWLIEQIRARGNMYVDESNMYKLLTGTLRSSALEREIRTVLGMPVSNAS